LNKQNIKLFNIRESSYFISNHDLSVLLEIKSQKTVSKISIGLANIKLYWYDSSSLGLAPILLEKNSVV